MNLAGWQEGKLVCVDAAGTGDITTTNGSLYVASQENLYCLERK